MILKSNYGIVNYRLLMIKIKENAKSERQEKQIIGKI